MLRQDRCKFTPSSVYVYFSGRASYVGVGIEIDLAAFSWIFPNGVGVAAEMAVSREHPD